MNKFKKINLLKILVFIFPVLVFGTKVYGADLEIVCDNIVDGDDQCSTVSGDKVFNESNWLPGYSVTKTISVRNDDKNDNCSLKMYTSNEVEDPSNFAERIFTALKKNGSLFYGDLDLSGDATSDKNLQNIFDASNISFGVVTKSGGTVLYEWIATFDSTAGNDFQDAETVFDISINFVCDHDVSDSSTKKTTSTSPSVAGAVTSFFAPFFGGPVTAVEEAEVPPEEKEAVEGISTEVVEGISTCKDPWWIWLLFIAQFLIHLIINKLVGEKDKRRIFHTIVGIICGLVFYFSFCERWYILISLIITIFWLFVDRESN